MQLYGTGGVALGNFKTSKAESVTELDSDLLGGSRVGWTVGAGVEYALDNDWSLDASYRYTDWGSESVTWNYEDGNGADISTNVNSRLYDNRILFALNRKLGGNHRAELSDTEPAMDWSGFYIGGHVGTSAGEMELKGKPDGGPAGPYEDSSYAGFAQVLGGLHAGYNFQINDIVVAGIEGDINSKSGAGFFWARQSRPTSDWDGSIRARLGFLATPRSMIYGTGGFSFGKFNTPWHETPSDGDLNGGLNAEPQELLGGMRTGWTVGSGIQYALDNNWSAGIEYRYTNWGTENVQWSEDEDEDLNPAKSQLTELRVITSFTYKIAREEESGGRSSTPADWSGPYMGGSFGASASSIAFREPWDLGVGGMPGWEYSEFTQGNVGGVVGFNYQVSPIFLVGVEAQLNGKFGSNFRFDDRLRPVPIGTPRCVHDWAPL